MAFTTLPSAGAKLRASVLNSLITELRPISVVKLVDTSRASNIVRAVDPELLIALPANSTWLYRMLILVTSAVSASGDFSGEIDFPTGAVHMMSTYGLDLALPSGNSADLHISASTRDTTPPSGNFNFGCSTTITSVLVVGRLEIGATPGNLALNWAQDTSNVNATVVQDGSYITAWRIG